MQPVSKWAVSFAVGICGFPLQWLLVGISLFALTTGAVYAAGSRLLVDNPAGIVSRDENDRATKLGLVAGSLLVYTPMFSGSPSLSQRQRLGVAVLLFGSMLTMWAFGSTYERAKRGDA